MKKDKNKEVIQQKYLELQFLKQHIEESQQQLTVLNRQSTELSRMMESLDDLENVKEGTQMHSQFGTGIFLKTKIEDSKHVIVNIGAEIAVQKTIPEAKELIKIQKKEMGGAIKKIEEQISQALLQAQAIQEELQSIAEE